MESQGLVFNSVVFLFCFLPVALLLYYIVPGRAKNAVLLLESIVFYCWGGIRYLPLTLVLVAVNYIAGLLLGKAKGRAARLALLLHTDWERYGGSTPEAEPAFSKEGGKFRFSLPPFSGMLLKIEPHEP